jgi:membrane protein YqaA with SNARE-associated domain
MLIAASFSPAGVVVLAALDSTIFFSLPLGIDTAVVVLAARLRSLAWIVPLLATAGSLGGAWLTFWMGRKIGEQDLSRYIRPRRLEQVRRRVKARGAVALAAFDLIPPPFPFTAFVLAAGALDVSASTFFSTLAAVRLARFGVEALLGVSYGRRVLAWMDADLFHDFVITATCLAFALTIVSVVKLARISRSRKA